MLELCRQAQVSVSGFYAWQRVATVPAKDHPEEDLIQSIFYSRNGKAGARVIRMILMRSFWLNVNLKKIRRIMKKHSLVTTIRRKNKYRFALRAGEDHKIYPNHLRRNFKVGVRDTVYSTDITQLQYGNGGKAYLSAVKDLHTHEVVHYRVSKSMTLDLATNGLEKLFQSLPEKIRVKLLVHSDQGVHYSSKSYRDLLERFDIRQSMSRKGNCLDNAPIESFFGHMKDEVELRNCQSYECLVAEIDSYIKYYNNERPQWGLKGKTPAECRGFT